MPHLDFTVDQVQAAIREVEDLGGELKKPASMYPSDEHPVLEWAVVLDPFGNEFCLIRDIEAATADDFDVLPEDVRREQS